MRVGETDSEKERERESGGNNRRKLRARGGAVTAYPVTFGRNTFHAYIQAERLRTADPEAFRILSTTWRPWRYTDDSTLTDLNAQQCPITLQAGQIVGVSYNNRSAAPLTDLPADQVKPFYEAMRTFRGLLSAPV